jgi:SAM-dependent methyltransferase
MDKPVVKRTDDVRDRPEYWANIVASLDEAHYKALDLVTTCPPGLALDLPAGSGRLSWWLHRKGFQVTAGDIEPEFFRNPEIPTVKTDLDGVFPLEDNQFDYAFCIDGPEHAENIYHTFREFARVLKPGGKMIVSYPNYSNLESRLRMIFYGVLEPVEGRHQPLRSSSGAITWDNENTCFQSGDVKEVQKYNGHINRQPYALLRMAMEHAGFRINRITSEKVKTGQLFLFPLYLLILLFTRIRGEKGARKYWLREANSYEVLMGGNDLILIATLEK